MIDIPINRLEEMGYEFESQNTFGPAEVAFTLKPVNEQLKPVSVRSEDGELFHVWIGGIDSTCDRSVIMDADLFSNMIKNVSQHPDIDKTRNSE